MLDLKGKRILVTGGSRGIGRAICCKLASCGAEVFLTYRIQKEAAQQVAQNILRKGASVETFELDQSSPQSVEAFVNALTKKTHVLHGIVHNAGINKPCDFDQIKLEDWDKIMATNLRGPFLISQKLLPQLKKAGRASVVFIGSVSGQYGGPRTAHYAVSKAGLISLSQVLARFGAAHGIRSNTLAAGFIETDMAQSGLQNKAVAEAAKQVVLNRIGTPEEVADTAAFLLSEKSSYITAQTINVNGGLYF